MKADQETVLRWLTSVVSAVTVLAAAVFVAKGVWSFAAGAFVITVPTVWACCYLWGRWFNRADNDRTIARTMPKPVPSDAESDLKY